MDSSFKGRRKTGYALLSLLLLVVLVVTGCQPQRSPASPPAPPPQGTLNLYGIDPITLDPAVSGDATSHEYIAQIFSGLVRLDDNLEPAPDIALEWQVTGGTTYTFKLRRDVRFHDGRPVKAADFKYSWERAANPQTRSLTALTYLGDIVGVKEVVSGQAREISGVKVVDDYTLQVTIDAPKSYFLSKMTYPTAFVVDQGNVKSGEWWRKPNGTGPFRLREWQKEELFVLEANMDYYGDKARVGTVAFQLWGGIPMNLYETGRIDVAPVNINYIDRVTDKAGPFYAELNTVPELSFFYIGFDHTSPPFDDVNIRRAFSHAIDKDKLVSLVNRDMMQRADGILPPGMPGFNPGLSGLEFNVEKARGLIAASGYGSVDRLPPITLTTSGWGGLISPDVEAVINEWRVNLGVEVQVRQLEPEPFLYRLKEEKDQMYITGWIADYPHPQDFLDVLFYTGADNNAGEYSNREVDVIIDRANVEQDYDRSLALYRQAEQLMVDDGAVIPLTFGENHVLVKPYVSGYALTPMGFALLNKVAITR